MAMNLSKTIYDLRREKGYTQENLAEMLGVSTAAVSKWECDNAYPDITLLPQLAEIFNVSLDYLMGYDLAKRQTISEIIKEANRLSKNLNRDDSVALIARTLARYPGNDQLIFELARHKYINSRYKNANERRILLNEAANGFETAAANTNDENRRAWAYKFLTIISLIQKNYDKARTYNKKIISGKGIYPKVDRAIIELKCEDNENALHLANETMYESIFEYSLMVTWVINYHFIHNQPHTVITEAMRSIVVLSQFNEHGLFDDVLSGSCEAISYAYAMTGEYEKSLDYLEDAYRYAEQYDNQKSGSIYNVYGIMGENAEQEDKLSSLKSLLCALKSNEREAYNPIREHARFKNIMEKLENI